MDDNVGLLVNRSITFVQTDYTEIHVPQRRNPKNFGDPWLFP